MSGLASKLASFYRRSAIASSSAMRAHSPSPSSLGTDTVNSIDRRSAIRSLATIGAAGTVIGGISHAYASTPSAPANPVINITSAPYNADSTGHNDTTAAFQAAFQALRNTPGTLYVPAGYYRVLGPLTYTGGVSISLVGDGQLQSVFLVNHNQDVFTGIFTNPTSGFTARDIGFSPCPTSGTSGGTVLNLTFPSMQTAWQRCKIESVDFGVPTAGYSCFLAGVQTTNCWVGRFNNIRMHSNAASIISGTSAISLCGESIDNHISHLRTDGIDTGINILGYSEGVRVDNCEFLTNFGILTGSTPYSGNANGAPINVNQLMVSNCEFNCNVYAVNGFQLWQSFFQNCHFGTKTADRGAVTLSGCNSVMFANCIFTGQFTGNNGDFFGMVVGSTPGGVKSGGIQVNSSLFTNTNYAILLAPGTRNTVGMGCTLASYGGSTFITSPTTVATPFGNIGFNPVIDFSGTGSNSIGFMGPTGVRENS